VLFGLLSRFAFALFCKRSLIDVFSRCF
jgi:hypothetical protein